MILFKQDSRSFGLIAGFLLIAALFVAPLIIVHDAGAQDRRLEIVSNVDSAAVYVDGAWVGIVADSPFQIARSASNVTVRASEEGIWSIEPQWFELPTDSDGPIKLDALFDYHYRFESVPSGAGVFSGQQKLGLTPLLYRSEGPLQDMVRIQLDGYREVSLSPGSDIWNHVPVSLTPVTPMAEAVRSDHIMTEKGPNWVNIAVTAGSVVAGALAVHYRTKADNRFDDYGVSGKESLRSDIRRLDVQSGVALGAMQAGLGFVAFRLAF
jgi:hypothetical protein